jgi:ubiquinone/menaquinone biosynthesis C-methylase UbiE
MKTIHKKNIDAYGSLYKTDNSAHSYEVRVKIDSIIHAIPRGIKTKNIAEVGYGTGDILHYYSKSRPKASILGIEVVEEAKKLYRKRFPSDRNVKLVTRNAEDKLSLPKSKFDLIIASHVLEHINNEKLLLSQVCDSLVKNGIFVLAVPDWGDFENHLHYRQYNKEIIESIGNRFSWQQIKIEPDGFYINKMMYKILWKIPAFQAVDVDSVQNAAFVTQSDSKIKSLYYKYGVNILLLMNKIDSLLFSRIDKKPMQWIALYKKK